MFAIIEKLHHPHSGCVIIAPFVIAKERSDCGNLAVTMAANNEIASAKASQ